MRLTKKTKYIAGIMLMAILAFSAITKIYSVYIETTSRSHSHSQSGMKISQQVISDIDSIIVAKKLMQVIDRGQGRKPEVEYTYLKKKVDYLSDRIKRNIPHGFPESEFTAIVNAENSLIALDIHKRPSFYKKLLVGEAKYLHIPAPKILHPEVFGQYKIEKA